MVEVVSMSLYHIESLIWQFLFGIDTIIALASYIILGVLFDISPSMIGVFFAIVLTYLPDWDLIFFFLLRKKLRLDSHWKIGHHPVLFVPVVGIVVWWTVSMLHLSDAFFWLVLSVSCVIGHFVHDSMSPIGLHWFSPFNWTRFTLWHGWPEVANPAVWEERYRRELAGNLQKGIGAEILPRLERISSIQVIAAFVVMAILALWFLC